MMNRRLKKASAVLLAMTMMFSLAGCVDQSQGKKSSDSATQTESSTDEASNSKTTDKNTSDSKSDKDSSDEDAKSLLEIDDPEEKAAVEAAKKKVQAMKDEPRIIATSPATADATKGSAAVLNKVELEPLQKLAADTNNDGKLTTADITRLRAAVLGNTSLQWQ